MACNTEFLKGVMDKLRHILRKFACPIVPIFGVRETRPRVSSWSHPRCAPPPFLIWVKQYLDLELVNLGAHLLSTAG